MVFGLGSMVFPTYRGTAGRGWGLAAGVPLATVSQRLSHARASTTLNVYAHSVPGGDRNAAETFALILAANRGAGDPCDGQPSKGG